MIKYVLVKASEGEYVGLIQKGIVSYATLDGWYIFARYGVNKTSLKKILESKIKK